MGNGFDQEDPLGILTDKKPKQADPLGILKKKEGLGGIGSALGGGLTQSGKTSLGNIGKQAGIVGDIYLDDALENDPLGTSMSLLEKGIEEESKNQTIPGTHIQIHEKVKNISDLKSKLANLPKEIFPDVNAARQRLQEKGDALDENNKTDVAAYNIVRSHDTNKANIANASKNSATLDDIAFSLMDGRGKDEIPEAKKGKYVSQLLNSPEAKELAEEDADFAQKYQEARANYLLRYPSHARQEIFTKVGQKLADENMTGWFYANPSLKKVDKAVDMLVEEGKLTPQEKLIYDDFRPVIGMGGADKLIPLTDLMHRAGYGLYRGAEGVESSARTIVNKVVGGGWLDPKGESLFQKAGLVETQADRQKRLEQVEAGSPTVEAKGFRKFIGGAAEFTGQFAPLIAGQAVGIPSGLNVTLNFLGHNMDKGEQLFKGDVGKQNTYAALGTLIDVAAMKLFPTGKVADGFKKFINPELKDITEKLATKEITAEVAKKSISDKALQYAANIGKGNLQSANALAVFEKLHNGLDMVFGKRDFNLEKELTEGLDNYKTNFLNSTFLSSFGAIGKQSPKASNIIYSEIAREPEYFREVINENKELSPQDKKERLENLDHIESIAAEMGERGMSPEQTGKFIRASLQQKALNDKSAKQTDKTLSKEVEKEATALEIEKRSILDPEMGNQKVVEEFYNEELLPKGSMDMLEVEGKFSPQKVGDFLKFIAQQANGLNENWEKITGTPPKLESIPEHIKEIANERWSKEIEKAEQSLPSKTFPEGSKLPEEESVTEQERFTSKGGNKVVNDEGKPIEVYHGTNAPFESFSKDKLGSKNIFAESAQEGFFFAGDKKTSEAYIGINSGDLMGLNISGSKHIDAINEKYKAEDDKVKEAKQKIWGEELKNFEKEFEPKLELFKKHLGGLSDKQIQELKYIDPGWVKWQEKAAERYEQEGLNDKQKEVNDKKIAEIEKLHFKDKGLERRIISANLDMKNPYIFDFNGEGETTEGLTTHIKRAKKQGHDGVIFKNLADGGEKDTIYVVFKPEQIKITNKNILDETIPESNKEDQQGNIPPEKEIITETKSTETGEPPKEPPQKPAEAAVEGEDRVGGITHAAVAEARKQAGLPEYEGHDRVTHETRMAAAKEQIAKNPNIANEIMEKVEKGGSLETQDNAVLAIYKAGLDHELENNPTKETFDKVLRVAKVLDPEGTKAGQLLESRKLFSPMEDNLSNFLLDKESAQGAPLTEKQIKVEAEKFTELKKAKEALAELEKADKEQYAKLLAELGVNKAKAAMRKASKKTHEEHVKDRKAIIEAAKADLKKIREQGLKSTIPGSQELKALVPHVKEYMRDLLNEGVDKLDNIVSQIHAEFKDILDGFTKGHVIDIIGGEYDEKRATRNEKAQGLHLYKREVQLLKKLAEVRKGEEKAKSEPAKVQKSRRIKELEDKIKEVRQINKLKEIEKDPLSDIVVENDAANLAEQKRLNAKIERLQSDLKNKKYAEEKPKEPPLKMSRKTILLKDKVIELEEKIMTERAKDEYAKRSKFLKVWDRIMQALGVKRVVQTAVDISIPFRQGVTLLGRRQATWAKAFAGMLKGMFNPKKFSRIMYDIRHSEDYHDMTKDGIVFNEINAADPNKRNEDFQKSFIYHIPVVKEPLLASNRAADAFLNIARYEMYMKLKGNLERQGITRQSDPEAYKFAANWTMNMTGRGKMIDALENPLARTILGNTFYGARLMASRFNLLNPITYFDPRTPYKIRIEAMKDMLSFTGMIMASGLGLAAAGGQISLNPWDSDFLQVRFGNKVYDLSGGLVNYVRTGLRLVNAAYTRMTGTKHEYKEATGKAGKSALQFFRNKLAPNTSYAADWFFGKANGQDFDASEIYKIYPMYADDVKKAIKEDGLISLLTVALPNIVGVGYGDYSHKGQSDKDLDTLLERNMRSDELDKDTIKNYNDGGREITNKEFKQYIDERDAEIKKEIENLFKNGATLINDDGELVELPYNKMTREQVVQETSRIKSAATRKIKEQLFGKKEETEDRKDAEKELEELRKEEREQ